MSEPLTHAQIISHLTTLLRAVANVAAQHERFKAISPPVYIVNPQSMRAIASAYAACPKLHEQP